MSDSSYSVHRLTDAADVISKLNLCIIKGNAGCYLRAITGKNSLDFWSDLPRTFEMLAIFLVNLRYYIEVSETRIRLCAIDETISLHSNLGQDFFATCEIQ